jgi:ATP-dependent DNA helicase RecG
LDRSALERYVETRLPSFYQLAAVEQLAVSLGLLAQSAGRVVPTVAGLLMFGRLPQIHRPEWGIAATRIRGRTMADPVAVRDDIEGTLPQLLEQALAFVEQHSAVVGDESSAAPEYPTEAVREALVNALVHRDYRLTARISLRIFDDRLEVWSPGGPIVQPPPEELLGSGGVSFPRNPILVATARTLGLLDQIGRGLPTIARSVEQETGQAVELTHSSSELQLMIPSRLRPIASDGTGN